MTMNATKAEVLTEEERAFIDNDIRPIICRVTPRLSKALAIIDRLCAELTSLRASRDEAEAKLAEFEVLKRDLGIAKADANYWKQWSTELAHANVKAICDKCGFALYGTYRNPSETPDCPKCRAGTLREETLVKAMRERDAALSERDAVVKAATMARDWFALSHADFCNKHNGGRDISPFMLRGCIHSKLDDALAQVSAPAPAREPAPSDAKGSKSLGQCEECGIVLFDNEAKNKLCVNCNPAQTGTESVNAPAPAAPATSGAGEQYEGVRVWKGVAEHQNEGLHWIKPDPLSDSGYCLDQNGKITKSCLVLMERNSIYPELHGPERLAVIEKALKLKPDLFGDPKPIPASERIHELEERVSELELGNQTARMFLISIKLQLDNALAAITGGGR